MPSTTVRISSGTHSALRALAKEEGNSMQEVLARAVEDYRRKRILDQTNTAYAVLRAGPVAWQEELDERALWESTLMDGLELK